MVSLGLVVVTYWSCITFTRKNAFCTIAAGAVLLQLDSYAVDVSKASTACQALRHADTLSAHAEPILVL
jgi:hypothetical protein